MQKQKHLNLETKILIETSLNQHLPFKSIARELVKDCTTISKEIKSHISFEKTLLSADPSKIVAYQFSANALLETSAIPVSLQTASLADLVVNALSSRYQTGVLRCANGDFSCDLCGEIQIFHCVRVVFRDFVIMVLSHPLSGLPNNLHIIPYNL